MSNNIDKLIHAQQYAMSIRPKIGGFPVLAEVLRQAGVKINSWTLPSCQSIYIMQNDEAIVFQQTTLITGAHEIPKFNCELLIAALRKDQAGNSTFPEFLQSTWEAGIIGYDVDFIKREVVYYGINNKSYVEEYPSVDIEYKL